MTNFYLNKADVVRFVDEHLPRLKPDSQLTMIITAGKSEDFSVSYATTKSSEDTELLLAKFFSETQVNT